MRLCTQAPEIGVSSAFPEGKQNREKTRAFVTHHYCGYELAIRIVKTSDLFL
jgi:hypothetical protein